MGRVQIASRFRNLVRRYVQSSRAPLPRSIEHASCCGPAQILHSRLFWKECGRDSNFSCLVEKRIKIFPSGLRILDTPNSVTLSASDCRKGFCYQQRCGHTSGQDFEGKEKISVTFVSKDGEETKIQVPVGMSMLEAAHENDIELEGACEGSLACSTCHVIVTEEEMYSRLPEPTDEENDMLDLAFGLTELSRLGCQVIAKPELDGLNLALPAATRNFAVDGHVPKPH